MKKLKEQIGNQKATKSLMEMEIITDKSIVDTVEKEIKNMLSETYNFIDRDHDIFNELSYQDPPPQQPLIYYRNGFEEQRIKIIITIFLPINTDKMIILDVEKDFRDKLKSNNYEFDKHENRAPSIEFCQYIDNNEDKKELYFIMN